MDEGARFSLAALREGSGVSAEDVAAAAADRALRDARRIAAYEARSASAWSAAEVAERIGTNSSTVRHMEAEGELYSLPDSSGHRFPRWQFAPADNREVARALPHLDEVLARLPHPTHPATVERFFTTARSHYRLEGRDVSAAEWLHAGGDLEVVLDDAESLHILG